MITKLNICLAIATVLLLGSCAVTDIDRTVDFNHYRTFGFSNAEINVNNPAYKSGLISSKIRKDITAELQRHGLVYSKQNPDLLVGYTTFTKDKQQMSSWGYYGGYPYMMYPGYFYRGPYMWGYPYMGMGYAPYPGGTYNYTEGTLIIDVTDARTREHVWRGMVKGNVSDLGALQKSIDKGVRAIMKKYPANVDPNGKPIDVHRKKVS
jgi:hypothetical protein